MQLPGVFFSVNRMWQFWERLLRLFQWISAKSHFGDTTLSLGNKMQLVASVAIWCYSLINSVYPKDAAPYQKITRKFFSKFLREKFFPCDFLVASDKLIYHFNLTKQCFAIILPPSSFGLGYRCSSKIYASVWALTYLWLKNLQTDFEEGPKKSNPDWYQIFVFVYSWTFNI